jgi:hypothetical protein
MHDLLEVTPLAQRYVPNYPKRRLVVQNEQKRGLNETVVRSLGSIEEGPRKMLAPTRKQTKPNNTIQYNKNPRTAKSQNHGKLHVR